MWTFTLVILLFRASKLKSEKYLEIDKSLNQV